MGTDTQDSQLAKCVSSPTINITCPSPWHSNVCPVRAVEKWWNENNAMLLYDVVGPYILQTGPFWLVLGGS